jgi:hypothetical protein
MSDLNTGIFLKNIAQEIGLLPTSHNLISKEMAEYLDSIDPLRKLRNEYYFPKMGTLPHGKYM